MVYTNGSTIINITQSNYFFSIVVDNLKIVGGDITEVNVASSTSQIVSQVPDLSVMTISPLESSLVVPNKICFTPWLFTTSSDGAA